MSSKWFKFRWVIHWKRRINAYGHWEYPICLCPYKTNLRVCDIIKFFALWRNLQKKYHLFQFTHNFTITTVVVMTYIKPNLLVIQLNDVSTHVNIFSIFEWQQWCTSIAYFGKLHNESFAQLKLEKKWFVMQCYHVNMTSVQTIWFSNFLNEIIIENYVII